MGSNNWRDSPYIYSIDRVIMHEKFIFNGTRIENDIGLARTIDPIKFNTAVRPIALPSHKPVTASVGKAVAAGFGQTVVLKLCFNFFSKSIIRKLNLDKNVFVNNMNSANVTKSSR